MQVKKFEARSMKEALEMVKRQLGPDAIILSARDRRKSFGLVGDGSVEITAAVAEETLHKKRFAESRMKPDVRERFLNSPAKTQRVIMDQFVNRYQEEEKPQRPVTTRRYIDIDPAGHQQVDIETDDSAESRIKDAAMRAWDAMREHAPTIRKSKVQVQDVPQRAAPTAIPHQAAIRQQPASPAKSSPSVASQPPPMTRQEHLVEENQMEMMALKSELEGLKKVLSDFQKVPQNFLGHHPGAQYGLNYDFSASFERLTQGGVHDDYAVEMLEAAAEDLPKPKHKSRGLIDGWAAKYILDTTEVTGEKPKSRIQCFVGARGSGKTSSLIKMASHAVVEGNKKVALLTADTMKVGSIDQMRIYSQILNVPFGIVRKPGDWKTLLAQLGDYEMIFCDFPGLSMKDQDEINMMTSLLQAAEQPEIHMVLSACLKDSETAEICRRYQPTRFNNFIFNHLDEAIVHGTIYNMMKKFGKPLHSFGVGPRVPEDFEFATKERVLDLIFKLSKLRKITETP